MTADDCVKEAVKNWLTGNMLPEFTRLAKLVADKAPLRDVRAAEEACRPLIGRQAVLLADSLDRSRRDANAGNKVLNA